MGGCGKPERPRFLAITSNIKKTASARRKDKRIQLKATMPTRFNFPD